jgi:hypothetical protein
MSGQKTHIRTEFHQVVNLTMTVRMEQYPMTQAVAAPLVALYDVVCMNARITFEALAADRAVPALPLP